MARRSSPLSAHPDRRGLQVRDGSIPVALALALAPASAAPAQTGETPPCVVTEVAGASAGRLDCLNQGLAGAAARAQVAAQASAAKTPAADIPTIGSPPTALGQANVAATRERLGSSFGLSVIPQRPAQAFAPPLGRAPR